jgi:hypothetical protein
VELLEKVLSLLYEKFGIDNVKIGFIDDKLRIIRNDYNLIEKIILNILLFLSE